MNEQSNSIKEALETKLKLTSKDYESYGSYAAKLTETWLKKSLPRLKLPQPQSLNLSIALMMDLKLSSKNWHRKFMEQLTSHFLKRLVRI